MKKRVFINLGEIENTRKIDELMDNSLVFCNWIRNCLERYSKCDWGDIEEEYKVLNDKIVLRKGAEDGRLLARYNHPDGDIYIMTERDQINKSNLTTILLREEYRKLKPLNWRV